MLVVKAVSLDVKIVVEVDSLVITWSVFCYMECLLRNAHNSCIFMHKN